MERKRFSSDELYLLRNKIPLTILIQKGLDIPSHDRQGRFCFQCPDCREFNAGLNPETNLARCFSCQKSFNTIDLVMKVRQVDFVDSVRFLKNFYESISQKNLQDSTSTANQEANGRFPEHTPLKKPAHDLEHIAQILNGVISSPRLGSANHQLLSSDTSLSANSQERQMHNDRIHDLEQKVHHLSLQIQKIIKVIDQNLPSL